jgi:hypothetical protein
VKNSFNTFGDILSVSRFVVPSNVDTPPTVYEYNSISTAKSPLPASEKCVTQAQLPEGIFVKLGTPESVAYVANSVLVFPATFCVTVCCVPPLPFGDHCL